MCIRDGPYYAHLETANLTTQLAARSNCDQVGHSIHAMHSAIYWSSLCQGSFPNLVFSGILTPPLLPPLVPLSSIRFPAPFAGRLQRMRSTMAYYKGRLTSLLGQNWGRYTRRITWLSTVHFILKVYTVCYQECFPS